MLSPTYGTKKWRLTMDRKKRADAIVKMNADNPTYINSNINFAPFQGIFRTSGIVTVPNFLEMTYANQYYQFLNKEMDENWWHLSAFDGKEKIIIPNTEENQEKIQEAKNLANQVFKDDQFSYAFYRTYNNHFPECDCLECDFRKKAKSQKFIDVLNKITGLNLVKNNELFVSRYGANCFLSVHNDNGNGRIAFIINLTKDWKPQYGGNFHLLSTDRTNIRKAVTPTFNSLTVFKVPEETGIPHYLSHVVSTIDKYRYAITGWFS